MVELTKTYTTSSSSSSSSSSSWVRERKREQELLLMLGDDDDDNNHGHDENNNIRIFHEKKSNHENGFVFSSFQSSQKNNNHDLEDSSLLDIQTMRSALLYLCSINADSMEVERFLVRYPEALLFEGMDDENGSETTTTNATKTTTTTTSSIENVVIRQIEKCTCFGSCCNENRKQNLELLKRGFEYYKSLVLLATAGEDDFIFRRITNSGRVLDPYSAQLRSLERDLREVKRRYGSVNRSIDDAKIQVKTLRFELEGISRQESFYNNHRLHTMNILTTCQRSNRSLERRSLLENSLGTATLNVASLERERETLLQEERTINRLKMALLKSAFVGCYRHMCEASKTQYD